MNPDEDAQRDTFKAAFKKKPQWKHLVIVLAFGLLLQIGRLYADKVLEQNGAPAWASWVTLGALVVLWLGGGNGLYYLLTSKQRAKDESAG